MYTKKSIIVWMLGICLLLVHCGKKGENARKDFYGDGTKTWRVVKAKNAEGKREKLSDAEKRDVLRFNSDGSFSANAAEGNAEGTWTYDPEAKLLTLQFAGATVTESHSVVDLSDDKIRLKAGDGSEMTLEAE
jgi:hypothetical protein